MARDADVLSEKVPITALFTLKPPMADSAWAKEAGTMPPPSPGGAGKIATYAPGARIRRAVAGAGHRLLSLGPTAGHAGAARGLSGCAGAAGLVGQPQRGQP